MPRRCSQATVAGQRKREPGQAPSGSASRIEATSQLAAVSGRHVCVGGIAQVVAEAPHGLDVVLAAGSRLLLLSELADEDVDYLELGLLHTAVKVVEKHL